MDTGGLAHMAYNGYNANNNSSNNGFGSAAAGYSSRGKGAHMKRLSIAPSPGMNSINEDEEANPAPRTARSQLLAGLRTAPRQGSGAPASAPYNQQNFNADAQAYGPRHLNRLSTNMPQSATAASFNRMPSPTNYGNNAYPNMYSFPHQMQATSGVNDNEMDPEVYNHLMQQNYYLLQKQQQLQAQLMNVTAAAQQFQGMNINGGYNSPQTPITPSMFNQQAQSGMQPIVQPTAQPGIYSVYNPMTGQHSYVYDNQMSSPVSPHTNGASLDMGQATNYDSQRFSRKDTTSPPFGQAVNKTRTISPPKGTPSPQQVVTPLPPPSANAYRPGHRRSMSNAMSAAKSVDMSGPKTAGPTSTFPRTPMTGTCGPGMARAGDHPVRQPRGPPPLDELLAAPTSLHEGSKNFASRQRRRAVHDLLKAGKERHASRNSSSDMGTPSSETEIQFFVSDADSEGSSSATGSASLSGDPTFGNASTAAAIGSEWKELKERASSRDPATRPFSMSNIGGLGGTSHGPAEQRDFASALRSSGQASPALGEKRRSPLLVLTSAAEKRKSSFM